MKGNIEQRLQALEDRLAIIDLISGYGPAVDRGDRDYIGLMWGPQGKYTYGLNDPAGGSLSGEAVAALVDLPAHREFMERGCAHILTTPHVVITGDEARAVNHSLLIAREDQRWVVERASANHWKLKKVEGTWEVSQRTNALLDGNTDALGLLAL